MPVTENLELYAGDDKVLAFTVADAENVGLDGATIHWKLSKTPNHQPILHKTSPSGGITITSVDNREFEVSIDRADTANLKGDYYHQCQIEDADGNFQTVTVGNITIQRTV